MKQLVVIPLILFLVLAICCTRTSVTDPDQNKGFPEILFLSFDPLYAETYSIGDTVYVLILSTLDETGVGVRCSSQFLGDYETLNVSNFRPENFPPLIPWDIYSDYYAIFLTKAAFEPTHENGILEVSLFSDRIMLYVISEKLGNSSASINIEPK